MLFIQLLSDAGTRGFLVWLRCEHALANPHEVGFDVHSMEFFYDVNMHVASVASRGGDGRTMLAYCNRIVLGGWISLSRNGLSVFDI